MMERKEMLLKEAEVPQRPEPEQSEQKLSEIVDEAVSYIQMQESRGWKKLVEKFLEPRSSLNRIISQPGGRSRDEATAAVAELVELTNYIKGRIKEGEKANEALERLKKHRR